MNNLTQPPGIIRVNQQPDGTLYPDVNGIYQVTVTYSKDDAGGVTAILGFMGSNQAALIFDQSCSMIVSYHVLNVLAGIDTMQSIENIIQYLNSTVMFDKAI